MNGRLVVDCDPGTDDAIALFALSRTGQFPGVCIATVGNAPLELVSRNLALWTRHLGESSFLANGAAVRCDGTKPAFSGFHGDDAFGGLAATLESRYGKPLPLGTLDEAADRICAGAGVTYVATGPLTTLAQMLARRPEVAGHIDRVLAMGGGISVFNFKGVAEYNFASDPVAVEKVFASGLDLTIFPLDLTCRDALLTRGEIAALAAAGREPEVMALVEQTFASSVAYGEAPDAAVMHDLMPCLEVMRPDSFDIEDMRLRVGAYGAISSAPDGRLVHVATRTRRPQAIYGLLRPHFQLTA